MVERELQLHLQHTQGQSVRPGQLLHAAPGLLNNYTFIEGSEYFDPDAEYRRASSIRRTSSPSAAVHLPFGEGRRWFNGGGVSNWVLGGWSIAAVIQMQSGFPIGVSQNINTNGFMLGANQRPNIVDGQDVLVGGSITDRLRTNPNDDRYLNANAFTQAPAGTFGNAPRMLPGVLLAVAQLDRHGDQQGLPGRRQQAATLRLEVINLFDNPWYAAMQSVAFGNANSAGSRRRATTRGRCRSPRASRSRSTDDTDYTDVGFRVKLLTNRAAPLAAPPVLLYGSALVGAAFRALC